MHENRTFEFNYELLAGQRPFISVADALDLQSPRIELLDIIAKQAYLNRLEMMSKYRFLIYPQSPIMLNQQALDLKLL